MKAFLNHLFAAPRPHLRACGPITLAAVLRTRGIERTPEEIALHVAERDPGGTLSARTYRMGRYAEQCGLNVAVLQSWPQSGWDALVDCHSKGLDVIINHAHSEAPDEGHYSALMSIDDEEIMLDDPFLGPGRTFAREVFCRMWQPNSETSGHVILVLGGRHGSTEPAMPCAPCPRCNTIPSMALNQVFEPSQWLERRWRRFFCLQCDGVFEPISIAS